MTKIKELIPVEEIRNRLSPLFKDQDLELVLLFGSVVSETVHKQSDIDLAFLFQRPVDIVALTNEVIKLLHIKNADVVDLKRASPLMKFSIIKNCKLLYEKQQGIFNVCYSLAFRMYNDTKKLRDAQAAAIRNFLKARRQL